MHKLGAMIIAGAICLLLGVIFILVGGLVRREASQLEKLPLLTTIADIQTSEPGRAASIDARIAERNELYVEGLVAYIRQEYRGQRCHTSDDDCEPLWVEDERATPPLWLDISDGRLRVVNDDYNLQSEPVIHQTTLQLRENETKLYRGFIINSPVFVTGRVIAGDHSPSFQADIIYGGDSASHLSRFRLVGNVFLWVGIILSSLGLLLIVARFFSR